MYLNAKYSGVFFQTNRANEQTKQRPSARSSVCPLLTLRGDFLAVYRRRFQRVLLFFRASPVHLPRAASDTGRASASAALRCVLAPAVVSVDVWSLRRERDKARLVVSLTQVEIMKKGHALQERCACFCHKHLQGNNNPLISVWFGFFCGGGGMKPQERGLI